MVLHEVVLQHIVLVFGEAGLHIAAGRFLRALGQDGGVECPAGGRLRVGGIHPRRPRTAIESSQTARSVGAGVVGGGLRSGCGKEMVLGPVLVVECGLAAVCSGTGSSGQGTIALRWAGNDEIYGRLLVRLGVERIASDELWHQGR